MLHLEYYSDGHDESIVTDLDEYDESVYNVFKATEAILLSRGYTDEDINRYYYEITNYNSKN